MAVTNVKPEEVDMTMLQMSSEAANRTSSDQLYLTIFMSDNVLLAGRTA